MASTIANNPAQWMLRVRVYLVWTAATLAGWLAFSMLGFASSLLPRLLLGLITGAGMGLGQAWALRTAGARFSPIGWSMLSAISAGISISASWAGLTPLGQGLLWAVLLGVTQAGLLRRNWFFGGWWSLAYWPGCLLAWFFAGEGVVFSTITSLILLTWLWIKNPEDG